MDSHKSFAANYIAIAVLVLYLLTNSTPCKAQLSPTFYDSTCPNGLATIRASITAAVTRERRMAASLIRLHFHDCFVQGCDASILLDDSASITSEKNSTSNAGSVRGYEVIDDAKSAVESICPGIVSCADIIAIAARDASVAVDGPTWSVRLGRRDSTTANIAEANTDLPRGSSDLPTLITRFREEGLTEREMVALSGSHTIGQAQCRVFRARVNSNGTDIDPAFATTRRQNCPAGSGNDNTLAPLDLVTPDSFDNNYYSNLLQRRGLLASDQALFSGGSSDSIVTEYSNNPSTFASDFGAAMVSMGNISPLTGQNGVIRTVCSALN